MEVGFHAALLMQSICPRKQSIHIVLLLIFCQMMHSTVNLVLSASTLSAPLLLPGLTAHSDMRSNFHRSLIGTMLRQLMAQHSPSLKLYVKCVVAVLRHFPTKTGNFFPWTGKTKIALAMRKDSDAFWLVSPLCK